MYEITLSFFAWLGVVAFHAFVNLTLKARKLLRDELPPLEASPIVLEDLQEMGHVDYAALEQAARERGSDFAVSVLPGEALDGDEPDLFFELLSQTGSEMMKCCRSLESIAREQIDLHERLPEAVW